MASTSAEFDTEKSRPTSFADASQNLVVFTAYPLAVSVAVAVLMPPWAGFALIAYGLFEAIALPIWLRDATWPRGSLFQNRRGAIQQRYGVQLKFGELSYLRRGPQAVLISEQYPAGFYMSDRNEPSWALRAAGSGAELPRI